MKRKLSYGKLPNPVINWSTLVITKVIYITIWIVLPLIFVDIAWWQVLLGFFIMHYVAGVILSVVFPYLNQPMMIRQMRPSSTSNPTVRIAKPQYAETCNSSPRITAPKTIATGAINRVTNIKYPLPTIAKTR